MSVRKYIRHSDGNCEKGIGFLDENESRYSSKYQRNSVLHEPFQQGKWSGSKAVMSNSYSSAGSQKGDRTNHMAYKSKSFSKDAYGNESQKGKSFSHSSPSRQNPSSVSVFNHQKSHSRNSTDDFEWSQHVSSSGKVYYYNRKNERSQWEKPREWIEREQQKARERYSSYKEGSRESRDSNRYSRSASRREGGKDIPHNKRDREIQDREKHPKIVKTEGASTSAVSTITSRSSVGSTPDSGSPSCSSSGLQDISPPTTPTNISMVSPYVNTSTPGNVNSPHLYSCSPVGLQSSSSLINQSSPGCVVSSGYPLSHSRLGSGMHATGTIQSPSTLYGTSMLYNSVSVESPGTVHNTSRNSGGLLASVSSELQHSPLLHNSNCSEQATERISPTPPLHPLQQATLLQKQQFQGGMIGHKLTGMLPAVGPNYLAHVGSVPCENSPPPPPPPHCAVKKHPLRLDTFDYSNRNPELRSNLTQSRSSPLSHKHGIGVQDSSPNSKKYSKSLEPLVFPELKDIQIFSSFCSKEIYEDVAAWYGNVLDRQANSSWEEAMHSLTQEGCRTKANLILGNFVYDILDTRVEVINRKLACLEDVHKQVESLQDLRSGS